MENKTQSKMLLSMMRKRRTQKCRIVTLVPEDGGGTIDKIDNLTLETIDSRVTQIPIENAPEHDEVIVINIPSRSQSRALRS